ncbi:MAG: LysR family transcriptional regulator [Rhodospirillales bacterium]|nr:MAG: LysR family transcriptional regulator [Rhodospirillales bacterium]
MTEGETEAVLTLLRAPGTRVGRDRIRLLQAIRDHGSIAAAARAVGLSYKAAWDAVNAMNNLFPAPLVVASPGGRTGGGAALTAAGGGVIAAFAMVERELGRFLQQLQAQFGSSDTPSPTILLRNFFMKTSARNVFRCTVTDVVEGPINAEVVMDLAEGQALSAIITRRSAQELEIAPGREVIALIKSTFVILAREEGLGRLAVRNRLSGTVTEREDGPVNSEFTLDIGGGKTVTAIVTRKGAESLELGPGDRACALVKASHIILAVD